MGDGGVGFAGVEVAHEDVGVLGVFAVEDELCDLFACVEA